MHTDSDTSNQHQQSFPKSNRSGVSGSRNEDIDMIQNQEQGLLHTLGGMHGMEEDDTTSPINCGRGMRRASGSSLRQVFNSFDTTRIFSLDCQGLPRLSSFFGGISRGSSFMVDISTPCGLHALAGDECMAPVRANSTRRRSFSGVGLPGGLPGLPSFSMPSLTTNARAPSCRQQDANGLAMLPHAGLAALSPNLSTPMPDVAAPVLPGLPTAPAPPPPAHLMTAAAFAALRTVGASDTSGGLSGTGVALDAYTSLVRQKVEELRGTMDSLLSDCLVQLGNSSPDSAAESPGASGEGLSEGSKQVIAAMHTARDKLVALYEKQLTLEPGASDTEKMLTLASVSAMDLPNKLFTSFEKALRDKACEMWATMHVVDPVPDKDAKLNLARYTNKTKKQITDWFTNWRARHWRKLIKQVASENQA